MIVVTDVLVGVIGDAQGRWLANRRRPGTHMAGFWEFPGGKRMAGETRRAALQRELAEELGIEVRAAEPLLEIVHEYPEKTVRLDVWRVLEYCGAPEAKEGQELRWVTVSQLEELPFLPADRPILAALAGLRPADQQSASQKCTS